jgi:hypothetical protein
MANEDVKISEVVLASSITGATILGIAADGSTKRFRISDIKGDGKGVAITSTNPGTPALAQYYLATPGVTYTYFLNDVGAAIAVPLTDGGQTVIDAKMTWTGTFWVLTYGKVTLPAATNKIAHFVDGAYSLGAQVNHLGRDWEASANTVSGEIPGTSVKWVERLDYYKRTETYSKTGTDAQVDMKLRDYPKTSYGKNLFDYTDADIVRGKYIAGDSSSVGDFLTNITFSITGYIPVKAGQTLKSNLSSATTAIGINLYDANKVKLSTVNNSTSVTASVDGYARFTINVPAATDISTVQVQIEVGSTSTSYVPYARYLSGAILIDETVPVSKLDKKGKAVIASFLDKVNYDSLTALITATTKSSSSASDISGWGATYNKVGISFNAIRLPAGSTYGAVADSRKWKYAQICIKNAQSDTVFLAKSLLVDISSYTTLPELVFPLLTSDLSALITLNDASFTGSTYWINIYYYNVDLSYAYGGNLNSGASGMSNYVAGSSRYTVNNTVTAWQNYSGFPGLAFEHVNLVNPILKQHLTELDAIQAQVNGIVSEVPEIILPNSINAIVGDTLQLFWKGIIKAVNPYIYDIVVNCSKGAWYPRYFEYTPVSGDVGTTTLQIKVKNANGVVLATKTCNLVTKLAVGSPSAPVKVLGVGDSLTHARIWPVEANRRLTGTAGSPAGKAFTNISFVGRKTSGAVGVEGNAGWSWVDYLTVGRKAFTFVVSGVTIQPAIEAIYADTNGKQYTMWWDYSATSLKFFVNDGGSVPPTAGALTKISGVGDTTLNFTSRVQSSGNPFWNDSTGLLDITSYVNKWCGGSLNVLYFLMTWNGQFGNRTDFTVFTDYAKTLFDHIHTAYPSVKIKLMGVQVPDLKGGVRVDGSPTENTYTDTYGLVVTALNMNKAYQDLANNSSYSSFVEFINVSSQFDSEYNMPFAQKQVNTRNSAVTESIGTNDVHPDNNGYYQIADVVYRNFIANFCQ